MSDLGQDFRYALRTMAKNPGFTAVVVLTLALGLGANTAIFGLLDQVLLRPLPVPEPERLVTLNDPGPFTGHTSMSSRWPVPFSHPMLVALREGNTVFDGSDTSPGIVALDARTGKLVWSYGTTGTAAMSTPVV